MRLVASQTGSFNFDVSEPLNSTAREWHFPMVNDRDRNDAYDQAIRRAVQRKQQTNPPGADLQVLDIGSGSGLLAMMAARAGASRVTTVEVDGAMAQVAKKIVATNSLNSRVQCVHNRSTELRIPEDMPTKADIIVSEILGTGLLDEGIRPTVCDALARLAAKNAVFIPSGATLLAQLVESKELRDQAVANETLGFDLSALTDLQAPLYRTRDIR